MQMARKGMDVLAADADPPDASFGSLGVSMPHDDVPTEDTREDSSFRRENAYHGACAAWHPVVRGDARLAKHAGRSGRRKECPEGFSGGKETGDAARVFRRAVLVCYPPPGFDSRMATETLEWYLKSEALPEKDASVPRAERTRSRRRDPKIVAVVGEWDGNTADGEFAWTLFRHFFLEKKIALPQWGDTAHDLTIWRRKPSGRGTPEKTRGEPFVGRHLVSSPLASNDGSERFKACAVCGGGGVEGLGTTETGTRREGRSRLKYLRRCVLCRDDSGTFCSAACCSRGAQSHAETHFLRLIPAPTDRLTDFSLQTGDHAPFRPFRARRLE
jgi:hypothetical protein